MLAGGRRDLRGGREVNKAVPEIIGAAPVHPLPLGFAPGRGGANFVDPAHALGDPACGLSRLGFSRIFRIAPDRIGATGALQGPALALAWHGGDQCIEAIIRNCIRDVTRRVSVLKERRHSPASDLQIWVGCNAQAPTDNRPR